ncbi:MAG: right-handed parallel beta-helix repeat-containing protein [Arachnia sp.]
MSSIRKNIALLTTAAMTLAAAVTGTVAPTAQADTSASVAKQPSSIASTLGTTHPVPSGAVFVSPTGSDSNPGTLKAPMRTVNYAANRTRAGGTVVLRGGVYREGAAGHSTGGTKYIIEPKNLTIQAYPGEEAWMDGTVPVSSWSKTATGKYKTAWSTPNFCGGAYYSRHYSNQTQSGPCSASDAIGGAASLGDPQMVFVNGREIKEVASEAALTADTFFYNWYSREIQLGFDPAGKTVEISKHPQAMALFKPSNVTIRDIGFRRYASNQYGGATAAALLLNAGSNVTLDGVVVTQSAGNGLLSWSTRNLTVRSSWLSNNGANGMNFAGSAQRLAKEPSVRDDLVIEYSRLDSNNTDSYSKYCTYSCSAAGIKAVGVVGANIRYNTFNSNAGNRASGLFFDLDAKHVKIVGNEVIGNAGHGVVYEVSDTGIIASNLISDNGWKSTSSSSYGLMVSSANTKIYNNTVTGNKYGVHLYDDSRSRGFDSGYDSSRVGPNTVNLSFVNNIVSSTSSTRYLMVVTGGKSSVPGNKSADQILGTLDHNSYSINSGTYFFTWRQEEGGAAKVYASLAALRAAKGREINGLESGGSVNTSTVPLGAPLPADVATALGQRTGAVLARGLISTRAESTVDGSPPNVDGGGADGGIPDSLIAADGFDRTVASGWGSTEVGSGWTVNSGTTMTVGGSTAVARFSGGGSTRSAYLNSVSTSNVSVVTDLTLSKAPVGGHYYHQVLARVSGSSYYRLVMRLQPSGTASVFVSKHVSGSEKVLRTTVLSGFNYKAGEKLKIRFDVTGSDSVRLASLVHG